MLGHTNIQTTQIYARVVDSVFQTGDGDVSSIFHKALFFKWCDNIMICLFIQRARLFGVFVQTIDANVRSIFKSRLLYDGDVTITEKPFSLAGVCTRTGS